MKRLAISVVMSMAAIGSAQAERGWSDPQQPFTIYGNTHYVGTAGIAAILITSPQGHILVDGTTEKGASVVASNIQTLGYKIEDVRYILSSHSHEDHAGGISALQKLSGAMVLAGAGNVEALRTGVSPEHDPQFGELTSFPGSANVRAVSDGDVITLGTLSVKAHDTPGHTAGGVSWTWQSCEADSCKAMVFADSLSAVSADSYKFHDHRDVVTALEASFAKVAALPCEILITTHPEANELWGKQERAAKQGSTAYIDAAACTALAERSRQRLATRLVSENS